MVKGKEKAIVPNQKIRSNQELNVPCDDQDSPLVYTFIFIF